MSKKKEIKPAVLGDFRYKGIEKVKILKDMYVITANKEIAYKLMNEMGIAPLLFKFNLSKKIKMIDGKRTRTETIIPIWYFQPTDEVKDVLYGKEIGWHSKHHVNEYEADHFSRKIKESIEKMKGAEKND